MSQQKPRTNLAERVYHTIYSRIANGDYLPDQKLPPETALSEELGISRPVLRDALERLREEGLVSSRQGAGSFVTTRMQRPLGYGKVETISDIQRCYEFRLTIEPQAAALAAERRDPVALAELSRALDLMRAATGSMTHREDADFAFHLAVARAANNFFFEATLRALHENIAVGMKMHGQSLLRDGQQSLQQVLDEHGRIHDAIEAGNARVAQQEMFSHIEHSRSRLFGGVLVDLRKSPT
ncbi:FadR/GntR family transcriptional regulator [Roseinatronobacter alkalisoli]|uniref:FadR/GntR family transcriptional regulator n=1 Tax=Roseinatronobacter alkalisoli TaxID=3028235 RepID=A0ABT5TAS3_9RHOB|nr:FadR/GntR family transcriptional regulator [Roseinatronobacter sp. HJB301]MDD7971028.1 FadR/GntR family transcriptional regulator [Roseinatronobacter sp. HJB301]